MPPDFNLSGVPPWGRSASEYEAFFALADVPRSARVLDCAGGPASFSAEWAALGRSVVAVDPIYRLPPEMIGAEFEAAAPRMLEGMRKARDRFRWDHYGSPENVIERRRTALRAFLPDFDKSTCRASYIAARLPELPFPANCFHLGLCSHLLFLYSAELNLEAHVASLRELLRVAQEVRVFPLLDMDGLVSAHLDPAMSALRDEAVCELVPVPFEFRWGDSRMLRLTRPAH